MKMKTYTVHTLNYPTITGLQHVLVEGEEPNTIVVARFADRLKANQFAQLLNQELR